MLNILDLPQRAIERLRRQAIAEEVAEQLPTREAAVAAIEAARKNEADNQAAATAAANKADDKVVDLRKKLGAAINEAARLRGISCGIGGKAQDIVSRSQAFLIRTADPAIAETMSTLHRWFQETRRNENIEVLQQAFKDEFGAPYAMVPVASNLKSIERRLVAIRAALRACEALQCEADQSNVPARLAEIVASVPRIEPAQAPDEDSLVTTAVNAVKKVVKSARDRQAERIETLLERN